MNLLPQFGFFELILVAAIALMVVGPKDLPKLMRSAGRMAAQARRMANEFASAFDQMAREAEMEDMRKEIEALKAASPVNDLKKAAEEVVAPIKKAVSEAEATARGHGDDMESDCADASDDAQEPGAANAAEADNPDQCDETVSRDEGGNVSGAAS